MNSKYVRPLLKNGTPCNVNILCVILIVLRNGKNFDFGEQLFRARAMLKCYTRLHHHIGYKFRHIYLRIFNGYGHYQNIF
jgi:hypothetical protein